jgi:hypothetical protein
MQPCGLIMLRSALSLCLALSCLALSYQGVGCPPRTGAPAGSVPIFVSAHAPLPPIFFGLIFLHPSTTDLVFQTFS